MHMFYGLKGGKQQNYWKKFKMINMAAPEYQDYVNLFFLHFCVFLLDKQLVFTFITEIN